MLDISGLKSQRFLLTFQVRISVTAPLPLFLLFLLESYDFHLILSRCLVGVLFLLPSLGIHIHVFVLSSSQPKLKIVIKRHSGSHPVFSHRPL